MAKSTTLITIHPGLVKTKLSTLYNSGAPVGLKPEEHTSTFKFATEERFTNVGALPKHYNGSNKNLDDIIEEENVDFKLLQLAETKKLHWYLSLLT